MATSKLDSRGALVSVMPFESKKHQQKEDGSLESLLSSDSTRLPVDSYCPQKLLFGSFEKPTAHNKLSFKSPEKGFEIFLCLHRVAV